jgi:hypothetical protein
MRAGGLTDALRHFRGHRRLVGASANAVCAEEFARHLVVFAEKGSCSRK